MRTYHLNKQRLDLVHKMYQDLTDGNLVEIDLANHRISINFSHHFMMKYTTLHHGLEMDINDYVLLCHPNFQSDLDQFFKFLIEKNVNEESRIDFKVKVPEVGNYYWTSLRVQKTTRSLYNGILLDINEFHEIKEQQEVVVNNSNDLIAKFKKDGEIIFASPSYCLMFGIDKDKVSDTNILSLNKELSIVDNKWFQSLLKPPYIHQETVAVEKNNEKLWISWYNKSIFNGDELDYIISVGHDVTKIVNMNIELEYKVIHDSLTGLYNRRGIYQEFDKLDPNSNVVAFFVDVNNFKYVNDYYGHETGDLVLKKIGKILLGFVQYGCIVGRFSGDEFIVLLPKFKDYSIVSLITSRLVKMLNKSMKINDYYLYVACSIGYAIYPDDTKELDKLLTYSDLAMYEAKKTTSKGTSHRFNQSMYDRLRDHINISSDLRSYIKNDGISVVYQSIIDSSNGSIKYVEALSRWEHKEHGHIAPSVFFEIAEQSGLVEELDLYMIEHALKDFAEMKKQPLYARSKILIIVSSTTLLNRNFPNTLKKLIEHNKIKNEDVCVEIHENTFVNQKRECIQRIMKLQSMGILIVLDDFGSKYFSISILNDVSFDIFKIDRQLIHNIHEQSLIISVLKMVNEIASRDQIDVVIEGVETIEQVNLLENLGFHIFQGFYYSIPEKFIAGN